MTPLSRLGRCTRLLSAGTGLASVLLLGVTPLALAGQPLDYMLLNYGTSSTFLTGIRGDNIVGNYVVPGSGGETGGLIYNSDTGTWAAFPTATSDGTNFPDSIGSSPYGPSFGSPGGILRVVGSYKTSASDPYDLGYLYDGAAAPGTIC